MQFSTLSIDLSTLFQFIITILLLAISLLYLVKITASGFSIAEEKSKGIEDLRVATEGSMMSASDACCVVCGVSANKKCSRCKAVRYCSQVCQSKHWKAGHKLKCKEIKLQDRLDNFCSAASLVPDRGICNVLQELPKTVLFPYDEFVKLFNWENPGFPPCGLLNCGNSCFANVVLQCLACTRPLVAYLLEKGHSRECKWNDWCFLCELQFHVDRVKQNLHPFSPINILSRLPNIGANLGYGKQEDAHEFMRFAIDKMQSVCLDEFGGEKALNLSTQETTLIQHIFGGHLQSQVLCTKCNKISYRYENMMDLTVEIQGDAESLQDCLAQFTKLERLDEENMYKCDGCNDYVRAWKRLSVLQAPNILTIALKRFQSGRFGKLNKRVTFPETLDLGRYMSEAADGTDLYRLYAVVVHVDMLNASFFGHYICYTKDFCGNWYRVDDCKVMKVDLEEVLAQGAYMLLYSRICARPLLVKSLKPARRTELQAVEVAQEMLQASTVSCDFAETAGSVTVSGCLSSDIRLQSTGSSYESDLATKINPVAVGDGLGDLVSVNPINVSSELIREDFDNMSLSCPRVDFMGSKDLEERKKLSQCSRSLDYVSADDLMHGKPTSSASSSAELSSIVTSLERREACSSSTVSFCQDEENGTTSSWDKDFQLPESPSDKSCTNMMVVVMSDVSIAASARNSLETNLSFSPSFSDPRLEQVARTHDLPVSDKEITALVNVVRVTESAEAPMLPSDKSVSGETLIFSSAFHEEPDQKLSPNEDSKAQTEVAVLGSSFSVNSCCIEFPEPVLCEKQLISHWSSLDKPCGKKILNEDKAADKGPAFGGPPCSSDCNGHAEHIFPDENGSSVTHGVVLGECYGNGNDLSLDCKKPLNNGEDVDKWAKVCPYELKTSCNGFVGFAITDQNGGRVNEIVEKPPSFYEYGGGIILNPEEAFISSGLLDMPRRKSCESYEVPHKDI